MTDDERKEAEAILGRAILSHLDRIPDARSAAQLSRFWEILLVELPEPEFDRFMHLTGRSPPFMISKRPLHKPCKLPGGLPDDIPF